MLWLLNINFERGFMQLVVYKWTVSCGLFFRLVKIKEWVDKNDPGATIIPFSGALELKLMEMPEDEQKRFLDENKIQRFEDIFYSIWLFCDFDQSEVEKLIQNLRCKMIPSTDHNCKIMMVALVSGLLYY